MAATEAWRALVRQRAGEAEDHCQRANVLLVDSVRVLDRPMRAADGDDARAQAMLAEDLLVEASTNLALVVSLAMVANRVALSGAAPNPAAPLNSFHDIGGVDEAERNLRAALEQLRDARVRAYHAWVSVQQGRGHLQAAYQLLDHERLPGVDGFLDNERVAARGDLDVARRLAYRSATLAGGIQSRFVT
jgi:hypothetical protein